MERRELLRLRSQRLTYPATFNPQIVRACLAGFAIGDELKRTFWPSFKLDNPARSTGLMCTNTSLLPSSGWMKPYPF